MMWHTLHNLIIYLNLLKLNTFKYHYLIKLLFLKIIQLWNVAVVYNKTHIY